MSKRDLLDLTVFDDQRKSEMVYKRPELVRKSDPSVYDKLLEQPMIPEFSKANYWTTAPEYEGRKFSDVQLDNPKCSNYLTAAALIAVWVLSQASLIPAYGVLQGDTLRCCTQLALVRFLVGVGQLMFQHESINFNGTRLWRSFVGFLMLTVATFCMILMLHHLSLTMVALLLNCDSIINAAIGRQRMAVFGLLAAPVLYYLSFEMLVVGLVALLALTAYQQQLLDIGEETQANFMVLVIFLLISVFSGPPLLQIDQWTFLTLVLIGAHRYVVVNFMQMIIRNYVRPASTFSLLKTSTLVLALYESIYRSPVYCLLVLLAVSVQVLCQNAYREKEERTTLIPHDHL